MKTLKFKTNINCTGCVAKVAPVLNNTVGAENWTVDTTVPEKILSIKTESVSESEVIASVQKTGFKIEEL